MSIGIFKSQTRIPKPQWDDDLRHTHRPIALFHKPHNLHSLVHFIKLLFEIIDCPRKFLFSMQIPVHCSEEIGFPLNCPTSASPEKVFSKISSHFQTLLPLSNSFKLLHLWKEYFPKYLPTFKPFCLLQTPSNFCLS